VPRRIVVKLGSNLLTDRRGDLDVRFLRRIVADLAALHAAGRDLVVVSSGAVAAGRPAFAALEPRLRRERSSSTPLGGPTPGVVAPEGGGESLGAAGSGRQDIHGRQMLAAVGQVRLMAAYARLFGRRGIVVGQALLARSDVASRQGYLNARLALLGLVERRIVPVVNENDVVAVDELKFGDNDNLSAVVATLVDADLLVILTDIDGLYTADPRRDPTATLIREVATLDQQIERLAGGAGTPHGTGGMVTKLQAARLAVRAGIPMMIVNGRRAGVLGQAAALAPVGTLFRPDARRPDARRRWLAARVGARHAITVDAGAAAAITQRGKSLLAAGVATVEGRFGRGDPVDVRAPDGRVIAAGLTNYSAADLLRIRGTHSRRIEELLGYHYGDEVIHRNNLVLV
jgi:glutamate 5-kinase